MPKARQVKEVALLPVVHKSKTASNKRMRMRIMRSKRIQNRKQRKNNYAVGYINNQMFDHICRYSIVQNDGQIVTVTTQ